MNPAAGGLRVGCVVDVGPGEHVVELVVRRVRHVRKGNRPTGVYDSTTETTTDDFVAIFSSQVFAMEIPETPPANSTGKDIITPVFTPENSLTHAALSDNRMKKLRDGYNDLRNHNLARGALNHNHLPGPVMWADSSTRGSSVDRYVNAPFPGIHSTVDTFTSPGVPAFGPGPGVGGALRKPHITQEHDGVAVRGWDSIASLTVGTGATDVHTDKCFLVVLANVQLVQIYKGNDGPNTVDVAGGDNDVLACFQLAYRTRDRDTAALVPAAGAIKRNFFAIPESAVFVNNSNMNRRVDAVPDRGISNGSVHADVPLMWIADMSKQEAGHLMSTQPPTGLAGQLEDIYDIHLLASVTPKTTDRGANPNPITGTYEPPGTEDAYAVIRRYSLSAFLLRY